MITTILWDVDDTLLDFEAGSRTALAEALKCCGIEGDWFEIYHEISEGLWRSLERGELGRKELYERRFPLFLKKTGLKGDSEKLEMCYRKSLEKQHVRIPGALEILRYLKARGYRMYVVTNGMQQMQKERMKAAGLSGFFEGVFASEELGFQKPDIRFFQACARQIPSYRPEETALVGDSLTSDVEGGRRAGISVCWFHPRGKENRESGARWEICSLLELKDIF